MENSITLSVVRHEQQGCFCYRLFAESGGRWHEMSVKVSLYTAQKALRIGRLRANQAGLSPGAFDPFLIFPESWPPEIIQEALKPRDVHKQLSLGVE